MSHVHMIYHVALLRKALALDRQAGAEMHWQQESFMTAGSTAVPVKGHVRAVCMHGAAALATNRAADLRQGVVDCQLAGADTASANPVSSMRTAAPSGHLTHLDAGSCGSGAAGA